MHSTYRSLSSVGAGRGLSGAVKRHGLTDPAVIEAYVNRRVNDPSLLAGAAGPSYADFFRGTVA